MSMYRKKENPIPAKIVMNRTLAKRLSSYVQLFPDWGRFLFRLEEKGNITEIIYFGSMWGKKPFQMKFLDTFFNYFFHFFPMFHIIILWLSCSMWLERCSNKTFPRHSFITRKTFFFSLKQGSSGRKQRMSSGTHFLNAFYNFIS